MRRRMHPLSVALADGRRLLIPWLDTRVVPLGVLCEYLERDARGIYSMARSGHFAASGCTVAQGGATHYVPARIWAANNWLPEHSLNTVVLGVAAPAAPRGIPGTFSHPFEVAHS